jgi:hypothetical protein
VSRFDPDNPNCCSGRNLIQRQYVGLFCHHLRFRSTYPNMFEIAA